MVIHCSDAILRITETDMTPRRKAAPKQPIIATNREIVNGSSQGIYVPQWGPMRPGAEDALKLPSRMGSRLIYRDGREVKA